eukprot:gnl/TRDRNA2_/TRDRNA2_162995_c0_seq2.p1 gnl/TRDRNA2_/TRDRNA2_162995_c0~~gnl/TRDRNA2_/TRDRNA2_162995_c0_seq2.p1  ORF type:complete len:549 (-),score=94.75 gnl/TRDRNA2_/TRDRNA2_162995_c0_seq2:72-1718(-)
MLTTRSLALWRASILLCAFCGIWSTCVTGAAGLKDRSSTSGLLIDSRGNFLKPDSDADDELATLQLQRGRRTSLFQQKISEVERSLKEHAAADEALFRAFVGHSGDSQEQPSLHAAGTISAAEEDKKAHDKHRVLARMQYWNFAQSSSESFSRGGDKPDSEPVDKTERYFLFDPDAGGLNNIRLGWEVAGLIALHSNRTLVLPPPSGFYLIDWNSTVNKQTTSKIEDFINLAQLQKGLKVITYDEFARNENPDLISFLPMDVKDQPRLCDFKTYSGNERVFYAKHSKDEREAPRIFGCTEWTHLGEPRMHDSSKQTFWGAVAGWQPDEHDAALLRNNFVWHQEAFELAAPIIADLGLFQYNALHARYGDLQYQEVKQPAHKIVEQWYAPGVNQNLMGENTTLYISSDEKADSFIEAFRKQGIRAKWSKDYFENPNSPIATLLAEKGPQRVNQLKGPVEQLVCTFGRTFVGTRLSTFTGYIHTLRAKADAPQKELLYHIQKPSSGEVDNIMKEMKLWSEREGSRSRDSGERTEMVLLQQTSTVGVGSVL